MVMVLRGALEVDEYTFRFFEEDDERHDFLDANRSMQDAVRSQY